MKAVKAKWFKLRDYGVRTGWAMASGNPLAGTLGITGPDAVKTMMFDDLDVKSSFTISFKIDNPNKVTVDIDNVSTPEETAAFKAQYEAISQSTPAVEGTFDATSSFWGIGPH